MPALVQFPFEAVGHGGNGFIHKEPTADISVCGRVSVGKLRETNPDFPGARGQEITETTSHLLFGKCV